MRKTPQERFWSKVKRAGEDECWKWLASKTKNGYGRFKFNNKTVRSHRYAYLIKKGTIPKGMYVCHTCDNRSCVNPNHLFLGNAVTNQKDMCDKGRSAWGENISTAKLKNEQVLEIINLYKTDKYSKSKLGRMFGVSHSMICDIVNGNNWNRLTGIKA